MGLIKAICTCLKCNKYTFMFKISGANIDCALWTNISQAELKTVNFFFYKTYNWLYTAGLTVFTLYFNIFSCDL